MSGSTINTMENSRFYIGKWLW